MPFAFLDHVIEQSPGRIVAVKRVRADEEYLRDHFPTFPVLPGVLMIETMAQAARTMLAPRGDPRLVLGEVKALKFGAMVRPGESLEVEVTLVKAAEDGSFHCKGVGRLRRSGAPAPADDATAVSGRFTMRPVRFES